HPEPRRGAGDRVRARPLGRPRADQRGGAPHRRAAGARGDPMLTPAAHDTGRHGAPAAYLTHFGLNEEPFSLTPDPAFLYLGASHGEAMASLRVGLLMRRGLLVMTGEVG